MRDLRRPLLRVLLSAVMVAGCTLQGGEPMLTGPIVFADGKDTSRGAQIKKLVDEWNGRHPRERVTMVELPESADDVRAQILAHAQDAGNASGAGCYDVTTMDVIWTAEFAEGGYVVPLDPDGFGADDFLKQPIESARYRGKLWAIPLRSDVGLLYYRKDILDAERASYPRDWSELRRQAMTFAPKHGLLGYVSQFDRYEGFTVNVLESIWDAGGEILDRDGRIRVDSPAVRNGLGRLIQAFQEQWIPHEARDFNEEHSRIAFQDGDVLFLRNWTYAYELLTGGESPVASTLGVAPLPTGSALGGWNLALSECSRRRGTARAFMRFLTSEESQRTLFTEAGFAPGRKALYDDPVLRNEYPHLGVLKSSIENARNRPVTPHYDQVSSAIQARLHDVLTTPSLLDDGLAALTADLRAAAEGR